MKNRLTHNIVQLGYWNAAWYGVHRLLGLFGWRLYKYYFLAQPVAAAELARGRGKAIDVRLATGEGEVPADCGRSRAVVAQRFAQGAQCLQAWRGAELTGYLWFLHDAYLEDEVRVRYHLTAAESVWDFDVYVTPEARLGPTFLRLWDETNHLLRGRGVRWSCSRISAFNAGSRHAHARLGAVELDGALFLCCGRWQWMLASCAPYVHLSRRPEAFPELHFDTRPLGRRRAGP
ncbi:hypothetical protein [Janthinobacterium sp.]|uniref:hypothetical protein n=1 Tax=Janthinobacterium sp. TaxID=1871054 RepID=UPI00293D95F8|nr:hypothetical protein [Janthinobacterium sp.]